MDKNKYIIPCLATALLLSACSTDDVVTTAKDDSEKTPIEFSMTSDGSSTSAVSGNTRAGFSASTGIVMRMVAQKTANSSTEYKYTKTSASTSGDQSSSDCSTVSFTDNGSTRYWDDAYGRDTKLSIYAVAVPGKTGIKNLDNLGSTGESSWSTSSTTVPTNTIAWTVSTSQGSTKAEGETPAKDPINEEDLVYSNNIKSNGEKGVYKWDFNASTPGYKSFSNLSDGQMEFTLKTSGETTGPGKFDKGNMNFTHALSRITINVKLGTGFTSTDAVSEATMVNMPYKGTLDVEKGTFSAYSTTEGNSDYSDIVMAGLTKEDQYNAKYIGQVLPGYKIGKSSETNVLHFKVGDNVYYITQKSIYEALTGEKATGKDALKYDDETNKNNIIMSQGQNYILNITVGKTGITNLTASLADWQTITADEFSRNNAYLIFDFSNYSGTNSTNFSLYRSAVTYTNPVTSTDYTANYDWNSGYQKNSATLTAPTGEDKVWKTNWYWDDNKTFYHIRMVGNGTDANKTVREIKSDSETPSKEYFEIKSGTTSGNYTWGAPMAKDGENNKTLSYDKTYGFDVSDKDHYISPAIGATNSEIHLTELNMLSHIKVKLTTSDTDNKVNLSGATVTITGIYSAGKVYMGNGLVEATGSRSTDAATLSAVSGTETNTYEYYVVPQALKDESTYVCFKITTSDGNVYTVKEKLSDIKPSSVDNNNIAGQKTDKAITYWYPNCCYVYTFKLTKAGINIASATLVPYSTITGSNQDVSIED